MNVKVYFIPAIFISTVLIITLAFATTIGERPAGFVSIPDNGQFRDDTGEIPLDYVDMTGGAIDITDSRINIKITVKNLPEKLAFNRAGTKENDLEYKWSVEMDLNGNNTEDLAFSLDHYKAPGAAEVTDYLYTQAVPGVFKKSGGSFGMLCDGQMMTNGNTIFMVFMKSAHPDLAAVTKQAKVRFVCVGRTDKGEVAVDCIQK